VQQQQKVIFLLFFSHVQVISDNQKTGIEVSHRQHRLYFIVGGMPACALTMTLNTDMFYIFHQQQ